METYSKIILNKGTKEDYYRYFFKIKFLVKITVIYVRLLLLYRTIFMESYNLTEMTLILVDFS